MNGVTTSPFDQVDEPLSHLQKAQLAIEHAAGMVDEDFRWGDRLPQAMSSRLTVARVQAEVSQAESLERIANALEERLHASERLLS